jgi:hypothetical protein
LLFGRALAGVVADEEHVAAVGFHRRKIAG